MIEACLLDTNILIDSINDKNDRWFLLEALAAKGVILACCSINVTEVYMGMRLHERARTEQLLRSLEFFPVTWEVARYAGELYNDWRRQGQTLSFQDVTIAAICLKYGLPLMTDNEKDFPMATASTIRDFVSNAPISFSVLRFEVE